MSPIQEKLLQMLSWFHIFCCENGLNYYLVEGSMLGAARHSGFIPWDDDIDVALPRPDYEKLLSLFKNNRSHYFLESLYTMNPDYYYTYAKLYNTKTTLVEHSRYKCKRGLFIDVFPLDGVGNTDKEIDRHFAKFDRLNMFLMTRTCAFEKRRSIVKNAAIFVSRLIPHFFINDRKLSIKVDKLASAFGYDDSIYVANLMGTYRRKEVMEKRIFGKPTEYKFENLTVYGVEHYNEYLTHLYGDWRTLPPEDKRKTAHNYVEINLNKSYLV